MGAKDSCHTTSGYHKDEVGGLIDTQFMHLFIYGCVHRQCVCICKDVRFYGCDLLATVISWQLMPKETMGESSGACSE